MTILKLNHSASIWAKSYLNNCEGNQLEIYKVSTNPDRYRISVLSTERDKVIAIQGSLTLDINDFLEMMRVIFSLEGTNSEHDLAASLVDFMQEKPDSSRLL